MNYLLVFRSMVCAAVLIMTRLVASDVTVHRIPDRGIQPQSIVDGKGVLHVVYYKGDPAGGDLFYVQSKDSGATFSPALKVNSQSGSSIAMGNIRGARIALGKNGRVHVAWMGSNTAAPRGPNKESPMLYARLNDAGTAFEEQRNIITKNYGLDGGGTVASDDQGHVFVTWHGLSGIEGVKGEENRRVWIARSSDDGKTFAPEVSATEVKTGACGCCGISSVADTQGNVFVLYRAAGEKTNRDMILLASHDKGASFDVQKLDSWVANMCPMSSSSLSAMPSETAIAWENKGQVYFAHIRPGTNDVKPIAAPGNGVGRKHPTIAVNTAGETLLAWAEGMEGWGKTGSVAWQTYDKNGVPLAKGNAPGVPKWSLISATARADGGFVILY
ncbi:MAG: sialidase family protein [Planctomycetota bacterium]